MPRPQSQPLFTHSQLVTAMDDPHRKDGHFATAESHILGNRQRRRGSSEVCGVEGVGIGVGVQEGVRVGIVVRSGPGQRPTSSFRRTVLNAGWGSVCGPAAQSKQRASNTHQGPKTRHSQDEDLERPEACLRDLYVNGRRWRATPHPIDTCCSTHRLGPKVLGPGRVRTG